MQSFVRKLAETVYLDYTRMKSKEEIIDVRDHLSQIVTALIMAPQLPHEFKAAARLFTELQHIFSDTHFSLLLKKSYAERISQAENLQMITYVPEQISFHGLPKKELRDIISNRHFDMVIDLNYDFDLVATCLCRVSHAKLRVCLQHPKRDNLYNFQVRADSNHSMEMKYDSLMKYLSLFKPLPDSPSRDLMPA